MGHFSSRGILNTDRHSIRDFRLDTEVTIPIGQSSPFLDELFYPIGGQPVIVLPEPVAYPYRPYWTGTGPAGASHLREDLESTAQKKAASHEPNPSGSQTSDHLPHGEHSCGSAQPKEQLSAKDVYSNPFADRLVAPGITSHATKFDEKTREVTEITNSLGVRWERREKADNRGYEWVVDNLPGVHGNFVGNVSQDAQGNLLVDRLSTKDTLTINLDGSYKQSYKHGATETWDAKTYTSVSGMPGKAQIAVKYKMNDITHKLERYEVDDVTVSNGKSTVVPRERIDQWGYHHTIHPGEPNAESSKPSTPSLSQQSSEKLSQQHDYLKPTYKPQPYYGQNGTLYKKMSGPDSPGPKPQFIVA